MLTIVHLILSIHSEHHDHKPSHEDKHDEKPAAAKEETPAWKKQALDQSAGNPMTMNWNVDKMEE